MAHRQQQEKSLEPPVPFAYPLYSKRAIKIKILTAKAAKRAKAERQEERDFPRRVERREKGSRPA
jgi:hypothetical protein